MVVVGAGLGNVGSAVGDIGDLDGFAGGEGLGDEEEQCEREGPGEPGRLRDTQDVMTSIGHIAFQYARFRLRGSTIKKPFETFGRSHLYGQGTPATTDVAGPKTPG